MPTLSKVADLAGVSKTTASLILNNRQLDQFTSQTRQRVVDAARDLRYQPKGRRSRSTSQAGKSISFVLSDKLGSGAGGGGYFGGVIDGIHEAAQERGLNVNVATNLARTSDLRRSLREMNGSVCGVLAGMPLPEQFRRDLAGRGIPVVCVGDVHLGDDPCVQVHGDNYQGGWLATQHLIEHGHRRIAFVGLIGAMRYFRQRYSGYLAALTEAGIDMDHGLVCGPGDAAELSGRVSAMLDRPSVPSAIFAASGACTQAVLEVLRDLTCVSRRT